MREIRNAVSIGLHEPEHLLQATQQMADANVQQLDRLGKIIRGRELRHALQAELHGERAGASNLLAQYRQMLQQLQPVLAAEAGFVTTPQRARARHILFLMRLENEALSRAASAALADVATARQEKRFIEPSMRATIIVALARVETRLGMLADFCEKAQQLAEKASPANDANGHDEDDL